MLLCRCTFTAAFTDALGAFLDLLRDLRRPCHGTSKSVLNANSACCGTTPLPRAFNCSLRASPTDVTCPSGRPIIHSTKRADRRCAPPLPSGLVGAGATRPVVRRSEEHTSELQSLMRISYAVFC